MTTNRLQSPTEPVPIAKPRPLPVFLLADVSTSMQGAKIAALNSAIKDMHQRFLELRDPRAQVHLGLITFASSAQEILPLAPVQEIQIPVLSASGTPAMGAALTLVRRRLEDQERVPERSWLPTIVLVSDGQPNDEWEEPLDQLLHSPKAERAVRLAVGSGDDCDFAVLRRFVNHPEIPVVRADQISSLQTFFRFVTFSVTARSTSRDPDSVNLPLHLLDDQDLLF